MSADTEAVISIMYVVMISESCFSCFGSPGLGPEK